MTITNRRVYEGLTAEEYFALPGFSFSGLKSGGQPFPEPTEKMKLGTDVHNYLLTPEVYHHKNIEIVRPIALALKNAIGDFLIQKLKPELVVTADFHHEGFTLPYKGRVDLSIYGRIIIDLKIGDSDVYKTMDYFRYPDQLSGYAFGLESRASLILHCNPKKKHHVTVVNSPIKKDWWELQILTYGKI